ncbi:MAG: STAS domain-containing protein [Oscillospiraceae bacterium]|nr:STAS domain-containing protein [Oscillospiraceae bacterium]
MNLYKVKNGKELRIMPDGRLDTDSAPELESEIKSIPDEITDLVLDFSKLDYISSAGLRVLLSAHNIMDERGGKMTVKSASKGILEVFEITGFNDILHIEI